MQKYGSDLRCISTFDLMLTTNICDLNQTASPKKEVIQSKIFSQVSNDLKTIVMSCCRHTDVATKKQHLQVLCWMLQTVENDGRDEKITAKAVSHIPFPHIFHMYHLRCRVANRLKAWKRWRYQHEYMQRVESDEDSKLIATFVVKKTNHTVSDGESRLSVVGDVSYGHGYRLFGNS